MVYFLHQAPSNGDPLDCLYIENCTYTLNNSVWVLISVPKYSRSMEEDISAFSYKVYRRTKAVRDLSSFIDFGLWPWHIVTVFE